MGQQYDHRYVIDCYDPKDWLFSLNDGTEEVHQFTWPVGPFEKNEVSDTIYHKDEKVGYHQHSTGYETFFIARGSVEVTIRGKRCVVNQGDILHIPPHTAHGFKHLEEGNVWRELFSQINMSRGIVNKNFIKDHYGKELYDDPAFRERYLRTTKELMREEPVVTEIPKAQMHEVRTPEFGFSVYELPGLTLRQKIGRWETNGIKEVWQAVAKKGLRITWDQPHAEPELYLVAKGSVKLVAMGTEYTVGADSFIDIPPYAKFSIEALEDGTEVYDCGGSTQLLAMLEDRESILLSDPSRLDTKEKAKDFMEKYGCYVTGCDFPG
ncbi:MAG: cupin domain-containing protein [Lachnospiraceae bacterium]|jgi:quercetin dioxygenase-like cupin family protein|nr:cupin domain-containing protein [Lachnospiraceae bacterium]